MANWGLKVKIYGDFNCKDGRRMFSKCLLHMYMLTDDIRIACFENKPIALTLIPQHCKKPVELKRLYHKTHVLCLERH